MTSGQTAVQAFLGGFDESKSIAWGVNRVLTMSVASCASSSVSKSESFECPVVRLGPHTEPDRCFGSSDRDDGPGIDCMPTSAGHATSSFDSSLAVNSVLTCQQRDHGIGGAAPWPHAQ